MMQHKSDSLILKTLKMVCFKRRWLLLILAFLFVHPKLLPQNTKVIDSLREAIKTEQNDTVRLQLYNKLFRPSLRKSVDEGLVVALEGLELAKNIGINQYEGLMLYNLALCYERNMSRESAIEHYLKALPFFKSVNDSLNIFRVHSALLSRYNEIGDNTRALYHFELAKAILSSDDLINSAKLNNRIGIVYANQGNWSVAARYYRQNLPVYQKANNTYGLAFTNLNIGICMDELGQIDSAKYFLEEGLKWHRKADYPTELANNLQELAYFHSGQDEYDQATVYLKEADEILTNNGSTQELVSVKRTTAELLYKQGKLNQSINFAKEGLALSDTLNMITHSNGLIKILIKNFTDLGNFPDAYFYSNRLLINRDSLFSIENKKNINQLEEEYQSKEKQTQLDAQKVLLNRQKRVNQLALLSAVLLLGLLVVLYFALRQRRKRNEVLQIQAKNLRELDESKSRFFANISHELKTPLSLILGPLENAIERSQNKQLTKDLQLAYQNGQKLLSLVNEVMDLSKLESGQLRLITSQTNLNNLLNRILSAFQSLCEIRHLHLQIDYDLPKESLVELDIEKFEKILNNLLSNAIKYSPKEGTVLLKVSHTSDENKHNLNIEVTDSGPGILPEDQNKIFDRFYQGKDGSSVQGGTGIGLALVSEMTRFMGGTIDVKSERGQGSTFILSLPLKITIDEQYTNVKEEIESIRPQQENYSPKTLFAHQPNVLIIEDNKDMSSFLEEILSPHFNCVVAFDGREGLEKLELENYDCVTCDVMMPEMDGFQFVKTLRNKELYLRTPVLMLTARSLEVDVLEGFALGVDDYMTKPFSKYELIARLNTLITNKKGRELWQQEQDTNEKKIETAEELQLKSAEIIVIQNISNEAFKVQDLATEMNYSQRQLERIIKKLTGLSPITFIKEIRLQKAYHLIVSRQFATIAEVRHEVGLSNASYFSKIFQIRFGVRPGELAV